MNQAKFIEIPGKLKPYIKQVILISGETENSFMNFADGMVGIAFQHPDTNLTTHIKAPQIPAAYVFGQTIKPVVLTAHKGCRIIGLTFQPYALKSVFRFDAKEITDAAVDVRLLSSVPGMNLIEQLWNTAAAEEQVEILFRYFGFLIKRNNTEPDKGMEYATSRIIQLNGNVSLKQLQSELNLTERTFERKFEQHVGISPSLFSGIAQFQASLKQLQAGKFEKLSDIAYGNGYADQSHFVRSFKRFTGISPLQFYKQLNNSTGINEL
ncbi:MAG TPA: AraC family transcriptional regulator [Chitinophaga sp.]|uniref:AraC family transcriptional regulator n=1 Tax=Chitinophaga sp. TaxID=1869181 RepID=UPI002C14083B|nr:AraC family transcriptional regulator [Chitinophaga sp.]HVI45585.1 AraC family transcriptional regulator [Chitinophaga sp.]